MTKKGRIAEFAYLAFVSVVGFFMRRRQLTVAFTAEGLPNGKGIWPLAIMGLLVLAAALFTALEQKKRPGYGENFTPDPVALGLLFLAAAAMAVSGAHGLISAPPALNPANLMLERASAVLSVVTGLCFVAMSANWYKGTAPSPVAWLLPTVYYILQLICSFKDWSADPIILDYCFGLIALVFCLMAVFHVGGFSVGQGKRRSAIFFCLGGVFFSAVTLADGGFGHILSSAGGICYLSANLWQLLGENKQ